MTTTITYHFADREALAAHFEELARLREASARTAATRRRRDRLNGEADAYTDAANTVREAILEQDG
jgi:hypothetical protein